jgi:hypothetical protein
LLAANWDGSAAYCTDYALIIHDWEGAERSLSTDKIPLHGSQQGYERQSSRALNDQNRMSLDVLVQNLTTEQGVCECLQIEEELATGFFRTAWLFILSGLFE